SCWRRRDFLDGYRSKITPKIEVSPIQILRAERAALRVVELIPDFPIHIPARGQPLALVAWVDRTQVHDLVVDAAYRTTDAQCDVCDLTARCLRHLAPTSHVVGPKAGDTVGARPVDTRPLP